MKDKKILCFYIVYWGAPYFEASLQSIYKQVDKIIIFYTNKPSQGFGTDKICPDTETQLYNITAPFRDKLMWIDGVWNNEGEHTNEFWNYTEGYDYVFRIDTDEIAPPDFVHDMIEQAERREENIFGVPFIHFWRCFDKVCRDGQMPIRLYKLDGKELKQAYLDNPDKKTNMYHMGYAIPDKYMEFKWLVSGHCPELRQDWFKEIWDANRQTDCHPVSINFWNTEQFDKNELPQCLKEHKNFNKDIIK